MKALNFRTLDLNLLRVFDEVMVERNLTRAAHNLSMTQPAVSNAMRRLRDLAGDELVRRSGYGVEPTPLALSLWPTVRDALQQLRQALSPGAFDPSRAQDHFVLAMADVTAAGILPGLMDLLADEAPGVTVRVLPLTTRDPRQGLEDGVMDLAVGHFPGVLAELRAPHLQERAPRHMTRALYDTRYVVVMRQGHPLLQSPLTLDRYCEARHVLVSFSGRPFGFVDEALAEQGRTRRVVLTVNQFFAARHVVATTDLLSVLPRHFALDEGLGPAIAHCPMPFPVPGVHVHQLWHRQTDASEAHRWLRDTVWRAARHASPEIWT